jgi:ArsR family transcriptional regulator
VKAPQIIGALGALAHEHRLKAYRLLVERGPQGLSAGAIAHGVGLPPSSLTFHLQSLHRAGLIVQRREGRQLFYSADVETMNALVGYLTENCCAGSSEACSSEAFVTTCGPAAAPKALKRRRIGG